MEYRVELGGKVWKNGRKTHILGISGDMYRYTLNMYRYILCSGYFWPTCTGTPCSVFLVSTSVCILAITCLFII